MLNRIHTSIRPSIIQFWCKTRLWSKLGSIFPISDAFVIRSIRLLVDVRVCIIYSWQPPFVCTLFRHPKVDPNIFSISPHLLCEIFSFWMRKIRSRWRINWQNYALRSEKEQQSARCTAGNIKPIQSDNFVGDYIEQDYLEKQSRPEWWWWCDAKREEYLLVNLLKKLPI